jgi:glycerol-3-phosphate acyltransferase PlsY
MNILQNLTNTDYFILLLSYLLGSIPFGLLISRFAGIKDIRQHGSGNIGATNVLRIGGKKFAIITLISDFLKGIIAVLIAKENCIDNVVYLAAASSIMGHIFPIWLKFKGGKGVATSLAVITFCNLEIGLFAIGCWLIIFAISRVSSLAAIIAFILTPFFTFFYIGSYFLFYVITFISLLVLFRHYNNFIRLMKSQEQPFISNP